MKKILFAITLGLFVAGVATASIGEYWSTVSHLIPRTNDAVDIGSTAKRVRTLFVNNLTCTDCVDDTNVDWGTGTNQVSSCDVPDHNGHSVRDTFVHIVNRGVAEAITVTLTGGLGVSWTTGEIYDRANHTFVATDAGSGNVTNNVVNYLKWVSGTTLTLSTTDATGDEVLVAIGSVYDGNIDGYRETSLLDESLANIRRCSRAVFPTRVTSGMSVHEDTDATNPLDVTMDAGVYCKELQERITPVEIKSRNTAMVRHFHTGGVWDSDTNAQIETTNYDNGTGKTAIPANKYVKGLFIYMNGKIGFVYPRAYFNTIAQAQSGALPTMPTGLEPLPKLTAVVYQQGAANFTGAIWQDVRAGISEESFSGVTDHGALAGLSDDDHTIYTLAAGTRAFTGTQTFNENLEMKDDKILYFDTAKSQFIKHDTDTGYLTWGSDYLNAVGELQICANTAADGSGTWDPHIAMFSTGRVSFVNTTQGNAADRFFKIDFTSGVHLDTGDKDAIIKADNIATADKTFQFPNASGTFIIGEGVSAGQTLIGGTTTTSDLTLQTTSGVGTTGADMHFKVGNDGATEAMTILNNGNVGIGTDAPGEKLDVKGTLRLSSATGYADIKTVSTGSIFFKPTNGLTYFNGTGINNRFFAYDYTIDSNTYLDLSAHKINLRTSNIDIVSINDGGDSFFNGGNVGIGTTTPDTPLHIYDASATADFYIESGGAGLGGRIILEDTDGAGCTALTTLNGVLTAAVIACP